MTRHWPGGKSVQLFLSSPLGRTRSQTLIAARLAAAGLNSFTPPDSVYNWGWGFLGQTAGVMTTPLLFCGSDAYAEVFAEESAEGARFTVTLNERIQQFNMYTPCDAEVHDFRPFEQPPLPPLAPLEGATVLGIGGGSVFTAQTSSIALGADLTVEQVEAHYRSLLEAAGWGLQASGGDTTLGFGYSRWLGQDD